MSRTAQFIDRVMCVRARACVRACATVRAWNSVWGKRGRGVVMEKEEKKEGLKRVSLSLSFHPLTPLLTFFLFERRCVSRAKARAV